MLRSGVKLQHVRRIIAIRMRPHERHQFAQTRPGGTRIGGTARPVVISIDITKEILFIRRRTGLAL